MEWNPHRVQDFQHKTSNTRLPTQDFQPLDKTELLDDIVSIPVESWRYKKTQEYHIGPVAEDFAEAFGTGIKDDDGNVDDKYLAPGDVAGVALAGVKELLVMIEELKARNAQLERRLAELETKR